MCVGEWYCYNGGLGRLIFQGHTEQTAFKAEN